MQRNAFNEMFCISCTIDIELFCLVPASGIQSLSLSTLTQGGESLRGRHHTDQSELEKPCQGYEVR